MNWLHDQLSKAIFYGNGPSDYAPHHLEGSVAHMVPLDEAALQQYRRQPRVFADATAILGKCDDHVPMLFVRGSAAGNSEKCVVLFHGTRHDASRHVRQAKKMAQQLAIDVAIVEYPGFGPVVHSKKLYKTCFADSLRFARACWEYLVACMGKDPTRMVFYGKSMGTAVLTLLNACLNASNRPSVMFLHSTFTSKRAVMKRLTPLGYILPEEFDLLANSVHILDRTAVFITHGQIDRLAPIKYGRDLAERILSQRKDLATAAPVFFHVNAGRDHDELDIEKEVIAPLLFYLYPSSPASSLQNQNHYHQNEI